MRLIRFWIALIVTVALIVVLDIQLPAGDSKTPRLGMFLSPQKGFWQNAEAVNASINDKVSIEGLIGNAEVYFDERLVPHIYTENDNDAYYIQGYIHAKFRLWQMEFQTHAAAGRLSEIVGEGNAITNFLSIDVFFRRLGMVYAAEQSEKAVNEDAATKAQMDAYTAGVNAYINSLRPEQYPLEYKILNYKPEAWSNLKTCLFLKYMSFDLAGFEEDFEMTKARNLFTKNQFEQLFPYGSDSLDPMTPKGTLFTAAGLTVKKPANADSAYFTYKKDVVAGDTSIKPDPDNGSNNWAVHGTKTASGKPILANDPHLSLYLPSLWFEMQVSTPSYNAYGVSFPGAPAVIIGFNDSCAWGFTNAMRDVRDYYEIEFKDSTQQEYLYNGEWMKTTFREEVLKRKGKADTTIRLPMTVWGPVMYDRSHSDKTGTGKAWACRWKAHDASNELKTFTQLNFAKNLSDYQQAIAPYQTPGQNMLFATKSGDIALRQQGQFPAKWYRQGDFLMDGRTDAYAWQGNIPAQDNITMINLPRGFVSSANQLPYDTTYPYYLGGSYPPFRGYLINRYLNSMSGITTKDMMDLQLNNHNLVAEWAKDKLLQYIDVAKLDNKQTAMLDLFKNWNLQNNANEKGASVFTCWWDSLSVATYSDELNQPNLPTPHTSTLLDALRKDSAYAFADNINTPEKETWKETITAAFQKACTALQQAEDEGKLEWGKFKDSGVRHLLRIPALSRLHLNASGGRDIINAYKQYHGPSWKMVVELTDKTEAYGIYPGGQSGNPGSKYYDNFVDDYVAGKYYKLTMHTKEEMSASNKGKITFQPA